jgi:hypothetical protein
MRFFRLGFGLFLLAQAYFFAGVDVCGFWISLFNAGVLQHGLWSSGLWG